jgi:hypothetical protein
MHRFNSILIIVILCFVGFVPLGYAEESKQSLLWDDDLQLQKESQMEKEKLLIENKYVPYTGENELSSFFDETPQKFYVYPEKKASLNIKQGTLAYKGKNYLEAILPKSEYTGLGLISKVPIDLSDSSVFNSAYVHFYIKVLTDVNNLMVAIVQSQKPTIESVIDLSKFVKSSVKDWQEVKIPISKFPKIGSCWDMEKQKEVDGYINLADILQLKFFYAEPKDKITSFFLDKVKILTDKMKKVTFLPVFRDSIDNLAYSYSYPKGTTIVKETTKVKYSGEKSLQFDFNPKEYSGIGLGIKQTDISGLKDKLSLEFMIKGKNGDEITSIGLVDNGNGIDKKKCKVVLPLKNYVLITKEWQKVAIPLSDFPTEGSYWDGNQNVDSAFLFDKITEVVFQVGADDNKECEIYIDDMRIRHNQE